MKTRDGEMIGGGYFVHRRGKTSKRVRPSPTPFEHGSLMAAIRECDRLAALSPGEMFIVVGQCYDARLEPVSEEVAIE